MFPLFALWLILCINIWYRMYFDPYKVYSNKHIRSIENIPNETDFYTINEAIFNNLYDDPILRGPLYFRHVHHQ